MARRPLERLERPGRLGDEPVGFGDPVTVAKLLAGAASIARVEFADIATAYAVVPMLPQRGSEFVLVRHIEAYRQRRSSESRSPASRPVPRRV